MSTIQEANDHERVQHSLLGLLRLFHDKYDPTLSFQACLRDLRGRADDDNDDDDDDHGMPDPKYAIRLQELLRGTCVYSKEGRNVIKPIVSECHFYWDVRVRLMIFLRLRKDEKRQFLKMTYEAFERYVRSRNRDDHRDASHRAKPYPVVVWQRLLFTCVEERFGDHELGDTLKSLLDVMADVQARTERVCPENATQRFVHCLFGTRTCVATYLEALRDVIHEYIVLRRRQLDAEKLIQYAPYSEKALTMSTDIALDTMATAFKYQAYGALRCLGRKLPRFRSLIRTRVQTHTRYPVPVPQLERTYEKLSTFGLRRELGCRPILAGQQELRRLLRAILEGITTGNRDWQDQGLSRCQIAKVKDCDLKKAMSILKLSFGFPRAYVRIMLRVVSEDMDDTRRGPQYSTRVCSESFCNDEYAIDWSSSPGTDDDDNTSLRTPGIQSGSELSSEDTMMPTSDTSDDEHAGDRYDDSLCYHQKPVIVCPAQYLTRRRQNGRIVLNESQLEAFRERRLLNTRGHFIGLRVARNAQKMMNDLGHYHGEDDPMLDA